MQSYFSGGVTGKWRAEMKAILMNYAAAAAIAAVVALSATASFAQSAPDRTCIPQYDSSGVQTAPYCHW
jgi:hypothetical protein